jgi:hypothetical protein
MKNTNPHAPLEAMLLRASYIATRASVLAHSRVAAPNFFLRNPNFSPTRATLWYFSQLARGTNIARLRTCGGNIARQYCANNTWYVAYRTEHNYTYTYLINFYFNPNTRTYCPATGRVAPYLCHGFNRPQY